MIKESLSKCLTTATAVLLFAIGAASLFSFFFIFDFIMKSEITDYEIVSAVLVIACINVILFKIADVIGKYAERKNHEQ